MYLATARVIIVSAVMPALATTLVVMRLLARRVRQREGVRLLMLSDYLVAVSLFCAWALSITAICGAAIDRVGTPPNQQTRAEFTGFLKMMFAIQFFYISSVGFVKLSVLAFYRSIFSTKGFRLTCDIMTGIVTAWMIAMLLGTLLRSQPISYNWNPTLPGRHGNILVLFSFVGASDIFLDIMVLLLPIPMIRKLHMSGRRKLALAAIFGLGGFCVISSTVRLAYVVKFVSEYRGLGSYYSNLVVQNLIWMIVEPSASVIAACLPTLGPLFKGGRSPGSLVHSIRSVLSLRSHSTSSSKHSFRDKDTADSIIGVQTVQNIPNTINHGKDTSEVSVSRKSGEQYTTRDNFKSTQNQTMV